MASTTRENKEPLDAHFVQRPTRSRPFRVSAKHYLRMADEGFFEGRRTELVNGKIIEMAAMKENHWIAILKVTETLREVFLKPFRVASQVPLALDQFSEPEPDVFVLKGTTGDLNEFSKARALQQTVLVIEVSDSTLCEDRIAKARLYAQAGIIEYWIVNLKARQLEVRRNPTAKGYSETTTLKADDEVSPLSSPDVKIKVADLLP